MDKDEILKKSREENKDRDLVMVCGLLSVLHAVFRDSVDYGVWVVMWAISSSVFLVKYHRLRKRHELALGLFYGALSVFFFVLYLRRELGGF